MHRIFLPIYRYFQKHKGLLYAILAVSTLVFILFGARLRYEEDIIKLLPRSSLDSELAFGDIGLKDKIFIQITGTDPENPLDTWTLGDYIDEYTDALRGRDAVGVLLGAEPLVLGREIENLLAHRLHARGRRGRRMVPAEQTAEQSASVPAGVLRDEGGEDRGNPPFRSSGAGLGFCHFAFHGHVGLPFSVCGMRVPHAMRPLTDVPASHADADVT